MNKIAMFANDIIELLNSVLGINLYQKETRTLKEIIEQESQRLAIRNASIDSNNK